MSNYMPYALRPPKPNGRGRYGRFSGKYHTDNFKPPKTGVDENHCEDITNPTEAEAFRRDRCNSPAGRAIIEEKSQ